MLLVRAKLPEGCEPALAERHTRAPYIEIIPDATLLYHHAVVQPYSRSQHIAASYIASAAEIAIRAFTGTGNDIGQLAIIIEAPVRSYSAGNFRTQGLFKLASLNAAASQQLWLRLGVVPVMVATSTLRATWAQSGIEPHPGLQDVATAALARDREKFTIAGQVAQVYPSVLAAASTHAGKRSSLSDRTDAIATAAWGVSQAAVWQGWASSSNATRAAVTAALPKTHARRVDEVMAALQNAALRAQSELHAPAVLPSTVVQAGAVDAAQAAAWMPPMLEPSAPDCAPEQPPPVLPSLPLAWHASQGPLDVPGLPATTAARLLPAVDKACSIAAFQHAILRDGTPPGQDSSHRA